MNETYALSVIQKQTVQMSRRNKKNTISWFGSNSGVLRSVWLGVSAGDLKLLAKLKDDEIPMGQAVLHSLFAS
jgi:hypothetical protein